MLKTEPSKDLIFLITKIVKEIRELATKENEIEILALIPFSMITTLIKSSEKHKHWDLLILLADLISQLSILIDEVDIIVEDMSI